VAYKFNPFTGNLDLVGGDSAFWLSPVATRASLPSGVADGAMIVVLDEELVFEYDLTLDEWFSQRINLTQFDSVSNASGITIETITTSGINDYRVNLHPASSTDPGGVSTSTQSFSGDKTFDNNVTVTGDLTVNGTTTTVNSQTLDVVDANITVNNGGTQASADLNDAGLTIDMSDATNVVIGYDSTLTSRIKVGDLADEREVVTVSHSQTLTNKSIDADLNTITNIDNNDIKSSAGIDATKLASGLVDNTEFGYLDGVTSLIQSQLDGKASVSLNNLGVTAINADLIPSGVINLGGPSTPFTVSYISQMAGSTVSIFDGATQVGFISPNIIMPDSSISDFGITSNNPSESFGINTANNNSGNSGSILIQPGTATGIRGDITLSSNSNDTLLSSQPDGSVDLSVSTTKYVDDEIVIVESKIKNDNTIIEGGTFDFTLSSIVNSTPISETAADFTQAWTMTNTTSRVAYNFSPVSTFTATGVSIFWNDPDSATGTFVIEIVPIIGVLPGEPDESTVLATTAVINGNSVGVGSQKYAFTTPVVLTAGVEYAYMHRVVSTGGSTFLTYDANSSGPAGTYRYTTIDGGTSWSNAAGFTGTFEIHSDIASNTELVIGSNAYVQQDGFLKDRNTILAQTITFGPTHDIAYVTLNKTVDLTTNISVSTTSIDSFTPGNDDFIITRLMDSGIEINRKLFLKDGESGKLQDGIGLVGPVGNINETSFSTNNNQATADVIGLSFSNSVVRSFKALVSVEIDATSNLYEVFELQGIQRDFDWVMSQTSTGDSSNIAFTITSAGQVQYTSGNEAGFVSGTIKFTAQTTSI